jgi:creatinine amidohydrolase
MNDKDMYYANLSWPQVQARLRSERKTVLLFPVGATEPHGPHAPLCTDPIISVGMCKRAVRQLEHDPELSALILPSLEYGVTRYTAGFPGPIHVSEDTLHAMIVDVCLALIAKGFQYIVVVNNHFEPEHVQTLHRSLDTVHERTGRVVGYLDLTRRRRVEALTEEFRKSECHAGRYETSLVLADRPELVDTQVMRTLPYVPISLVDAMSRGVKDFIPMGLVQAYNGAPAEATPEEGQAVFETLTGMLVALMRDLVRGTGGRDRPGIYQRM